MSPACELDCSDVFDERRFRTESIALLRALLASTATSDTEPTILYDVQPDNSYTAFYRTILVECDGTIVITDTELDGETPYVPTGTVVATLPVLEETLVSHGVEISGDYTIPTGFVQASVAVLTGSLDIDGVTYPIGSTLNLPPLSFGNIDRFYPELNITNVTGTAIVYYTTRV